MGLFAQAVQQGSIAGEALDAGGRPLANIPVELLRAVAGQPVGGAVQTTTTDSRGAWTFTNLAAGDYVVRIIVNGQIAGVPVSIGAGESFGGVLIVAPSAAAVSQALGFATWAAAVLFYGSAAAAIAAAAYVISDGS